MDVGPFALGRGWAPAPTPSEELGRRHTSPGRARPLNGAAPPGDGVSDSSETDEEACGDRKVADLPAIGGGRGTADERAADRRRAVAEEQAVESHV